MYKKYLKSSYLCIVSSLYLYFFSTSVIAYDWKSIDKSQIEDFYFGMDQVFSILQSKNILDSESQSKAIQLVNDNANKYLNFDRHQMHVDDLYELQYSLRFYNSQIQKLVQDLFLQKKVSLDFKQKIFFAAQILDFKNQSLYVTPQKKLPIYGIESSEWPLSRWIKNKEFYKYQFDAEGNLLYRNLKLKSGDILVNNPIESPVGLFTATALDKSLFAHSAVVVFLNRKQGVLPIVVDVYAKGVRAVPLHLYLSKQIIGFTEIYRFKDQTQDYANQLEGHIVEILKHQFAYDLSGSHDHKKALSCTEFVSYILELMHNAPLENKSIIHPDIYKNILNLGYLEQKFNMPNDVLKDSRFELIGFVDNLISVHEMITNELLLAQFHATLLHRILNPDNYRFLLFLGGIAIDEARFQFSPLGNLILMIAGFDRENFPVGAKNILITVDIFDTLFKKAMDSCMDVDGESQGNHTTSCYKGIEHYLTAQKKKKETRFSIHDILNHAELNHIFALELSQFKDMFD